MDENNTVSENPVTASGLAVNTMAGVGPAPAPASLADLEAVKADLLRLHADTVSQVAALVQTVEDIKAGNSAAVSADALKDVTLGLANVSEDVADIKAAHADSAALLTKVRAYVAQNWHLFG